MKTIKKYTSANSTSSGNSVSQSTGSNEPKGSQSNPYSYSEYSSIPEDQWTGGYVEGLGYVLATVEVHGSTSDSSDAFSDMFSDPFSNPFSDMFSDMSSFWDTSESGGGSGGGNHNGNNGGGGNGGGHGSGNPITKYQQQLNRLYAKMPQSLKNAVEHLNVKFAFDTSLRKPAQYDIRHLFIKINPNSLESYNLFHELLHVWQHDNGYIDRYCSHANPEFEAHVITDVYKIYFCYSGLGMSAINHNNDYEGLLIDCSYDNNGNNLKPFDVNHFKDNIGSFFEDFRNCHKGSKAGDDAPNPDYIWHWDEYFLILFSNQQ